MLGIQDVVPGKNVPPSNPLKDLLFKTLGTVVSLKICFLFHIIIILYVLKIFDDLKVKTILIKKLKILF